MVQHIKKKAPNIYDNSGHGTEEISPDPKSFRLDTLSSNKVAMTLHYPKDQGSWKMTANSFGVSNSTMSVILQFIIEATLKIRSQYIHLLSIRQEIKEPTAASEISLVFHKFLVVLIGPISQ